jgi:hypothetical protein
VDKEIQLPGTVGVDTQGVGVRLRFAVVVAAGTFVSASAATCEKATAWPLGRGFTATMYVGTPYPGSTIAWRTLVIRERGRILRRFSHQNNGLGIQFTDITGDGVNEILVLDYWGGSGGCGAYTLFGGSRFSALWRRGTWCADDQIARFVGSALVTWSAVLSSQTPATRGSIHCCYATWRRTEWRWRAGRLTRAGSTLGPPPQLRWRVGLLPGTHPRC